MGICAPCFALCEARSTVEPHAYLKPVLTELLAERKAVTYRCTVCKSHWRRSIPYPGFRGSPHFWERIGGDGVITFDDP